MIGLRACGMLVAMLLTGGMAMDRVSRTDAPITKILRRPVRSEIFAAGIAAARVPTRASTDISCRALSTAPPSRPTQSWRA